MVFPIYQSWAGLSSVPSGWLTYGNASDTIITYHANHITLTTTGNVASNPYTAALYTNYSFSAPVSLYSDMQFYDNNPGGDENAVGFYSSTPATHQA